MSNTSFDMFCHCTDCGCIIQYPDSWDSDYGIQCDECASLEADGIVGAYMANQEDSEQC